MSEYQKIRMSGSLSFLKLLGEFKQKVVVGEAPDVDFPDFFIKG